MTYKTPGVYVKEVSFLPPSVAEVETAIPAFIGYTENIEFEGESLLNTPTKIKSALDFETIFGFDSNPSAITVSLNASNAPQNVSIDPKYFLYKSVQMFYANGGDKCYIVSVGQYKANGGVDYAELKAGLDALEKYDEPTMILFPDAMLLNNPNQLYTLQNDTLMQCAKLQDRFGIFDLYESRQGDPNFDWEDGRDEFRNSLGINDLKYGAAYVPHLKTILPTDFSFFDISLVDTNALPVNLRDISADPSSLDALVEVNNDAQTIETFTAGIQAQYDAIANSDNEAEVNARITHINDLLTRILIPGTPNNLFDDLESSNSESLFVTLAQLKLKNRLQFLYEAELTFFDDVNDIQDNNPLPNTWGTNPTGLNPVVIDPNDYLNLAYNGTPVDYELGTVAFSPTPGESIYGNAPADLAGIVANARVGLNSLVGLIIQDLQTLQQQVNQSIANFEADLINTNGIYSAIVDAISSHGSIIPPSGAMAGIYSKVDASRGVHKAPANVSVNSVVGPTVVIDHSDQEDLNVDVNAGKSINAIRTFTGKGTLVWGARTLAGNDNEWRYVSVRRFFNMVEESIKKSTGWAVFEPNDANTWSLVKGMIFNYLYDKWQEGALQGATPDEAFYVHIGEGITFTSAEKLQGIMRVKIGMAVVRPAEFIELVFSHKMSGPS